MSGQMNVDVLVVGSGAAGLSAAVTAALGGASVLVAEKESVIGGTSAWSGGWLWIPRNPLAREEGIEEEPGAPLAYLRHEMDGEPADARLLAFLQYGPEMIDFSAAAPPCSFFPAAKCPIFTLHRALRWAAARSRRSLLTDGCWATGCIACGLRWRPSALRVWALPAARTWRTFSTRPAHRARRCMRPAACCVTAGSGCALVADSIWLTATRWSLACCVRRWMRGLIFSLTRR